MCRLGIFQCGHEVCVVHALVPQDLAWLVDPVHDLLTNAGSVCFVTRVLFEVTISFFRLAEYGFL